MVAEGAVFGGDSCDGTDTLGTDEVYETNLGACVGWITTTVGFVVNYDGNVSGGECGVSGVSTSDDAGLAQLKSCSICLISFFISSPNEGR